MTTFVSAIDRKYMRLALSLAKQGGARVSPNPAVGCVIVKDGKLIGKGYHEYFGGPHAEVRALGIAGKNARGSTLYVTLEPCNHYGKTPPCTLAIRRAKVSRVVAAIRDPNPRVNGRGLRYLKKNGIQVTEGVLAGQAHRLVISKGTKARAGKSCVLVKYAATADGKIATRTGDSKWISSTRSRAYVHELRSRMDAIVVGATTVRRDNPVLTSHGHGRNPVRVVIDPNLSLPSTCRVFDDSASTIIIHSCKPSREKLLAFRRRKILMTRLPETRGRIDFGEIVSRLRTYALRRILVEGGGETIASAFESQLVTHVAVFLAPKIIGGGNAITPVEGRGIATIRDAIRLRDVKVSRKGTDVLLTAGVTYRKSTQR